MSVIGSNILSGASGQGGGYTIDNSVRFNQPDDPKLSRTFASEGNKRTWTFSAWVKVGKFTADSLVGFTLNRLQLMKNVVFYRVSLRFKPNCMGLCIWEGLFKPNAAGLCASRGFRGLV